MESLTEELERLNQLRTEIQSIIADKSEAKQNPEFYKSIKHFIDFKQWIIELGISDEEIKKRFDEFENVCLSIAQHDFIRMEIFNRGEKDIFNLMAASINTVSRELEISSTRKHYLQETIEHVPYLALITNVKGVILFANEAAGKLLNRQKDNLIALQVANIFESKTQFGTKAEMGGSFADKKVKIQPYNSKTVTINLSVKELKNPQTEEVDGYLYIGKEMRLSQKGQPLFFRA